MTATNPTTEPTAAPALPTGPVGYIAQVSYGRYPHEAGRPIGELHGAFILVYAVTSYSYARDDNGPRDRSGTSLEPLALIVINRDDDEPLTSEHVTTVSRALVQDWIVANVGWSYVSVAFLPSTYHTTLSSYATQLSIVRDHVQAWDAPVVRA